MGGAARLCKARGVDRLLLCVSLVAAFGCRASTVHLASGASLEARPVQSTGDAVEVEVELDDGTTETRTLARDEIASVDHPGLERAIIGGVLTAGFLGGGLYAMTATQSCGEESCDMPLTIGAALGLAYMSIGSAIFIRGLHLRLRSKSVFAGDHDLQAARRRYVRAGVGLIGAGVLAAGLGLAIGAPPPNEDAYSPEGQDLTPGTAMALFLPATVTWVAAGAVFIARGRRLGARSDDGPEVSVSAAPTRGGAFGSLTLLY